MNYWPRWIGSIQKKTSHLSLAEMGAYDRLLDHYYAHEAPLPSDLDRCCRVAGAVTKAEREAVARVLAEYFTLEDAGYVNARAASEIAEAKPKIDAARANGALGGRPRKAQKEPDKKPTGFPNGLPTGNPAQTQGESSTTTLLVPTEPKNPPTPRKREGVHGFPPGFDAFWALYPRRENKAKAAQAFARIRPDEALLAAILAGLRRQVASEQWRKDGGQFIPHPTTWLNGRRWEDEGSSSSVANDVFAGAA